MRIKDNELCYYYPFLIMMLISCVGNDIFSVKKSKLYRIEVENILTLILSGSWNQVFAMIE